MASSSLRIRTATEADAGAWNRLVERCPRGTFYVRYEWLGINRAALGHQVLPLVAERDGELVGVLPLVRVRSRLFGDILCSMPFVNYGGPVSLDPEVEDELVREACRRTEALGCHRLEIRDRRPLANLPTSTRKVSMVIDLPDTAEEAWEGFRSKHRTNIRKASENSLQLETGGSELLDPFYRLMERGWRALGTPLFRQAMFKKVLTVLPESTRIHVAWKDGHPVAATLNGETGSTIEGLWAAQDPETLHLNANYVLYWAMIEDACHRGFRSFNLGRSTAGSGAVQFKARWGAVPRQLYWNHHLPSGGPLPELNPDNPRYGAAISIWRRLPLPVTRAVGPFLARRIP